MLIKSKGNKDKKTWVHPSRKKILDTLYGRDTTKNTFGWTPEGGKTKREVGDRWTDVDGKEWEQKEGYIISVSKLDDVREYIDSLSTCKNKKCQTINPKGINLKFIRQTGYCINCMAEKEHNFRVKNLFNEYETWKMNTKLIGELKDNLPKYEQALRDADIIPSFVQEDGTIEKWSFDGDLEKIKNDIKEDIEKTKQLITETQSKIDIGWEKIKEVYNETFEL